MTGFTIPSGVVTFNQGFTPYPSFLREPAQQTSQDQAVPFTVDWGNSAGSGAVAPAIDIDIGANYNGAKPFQLVQALFVDNVVCRVDVRFIFAETGFILTVPAGSCGVYPVVSLGNRFYMVPLGPFGATAGDFTNITAFNYPVAPFSVDKTVYATNDSAINVALAAGTTALVASGNGVLEGLGVSLTGVAAGAGAGGIMSWTVQDGAGKVLAKGAVGCPSSATFGPTDLFDQAAMNETYTNGINIVVAVVTGPGTFTFGSLNFNAFVR